MSIKVCKACKEPKPLSEFYVDKVFKGRVYHRALCMKCYNQNCIANIHHEKIPSRVSDDNIITTPMPSTTMYKHSEFVDALVSLGRFDSARLSRITKEEFVSKTNSGAALLQASEAFSAIKRDALQWLSDNGYDRPIHRDLPPGTYMVVSDSHGKHTRTGVFKLMKSVCKDLGVDAVLHVGHMLDDDNIVSNLWSEMGELVVLAKPEELKTLHARKFDIIRGEVSIGDISVLNQEFITDYVQVQLSNLSSEIFKGKVICNSHRFERLPRAGMGEDGCSEWVISPGCLCEPHIVRTVKQIDFTAGYQVKQTYPLSYVKYRRASQLCQSWTSGFALVKFDGKKTWSTMCAIEHMPDGSFATCVFGKVYSSGKPAKVTNTGLVVTDAHAPSICLKTLSIQEQVARSLKPDYLVDLGDFADFRSINPHCFKRGDVETTASRSLIRDAGIVHWSLAYKADWAPEKYALVGNHERFANDFTARMPQLREIIDPINIVGLGELGYTIVPLKKPLYIGSAIYIHGDAKCFGVAGSKLDKLAKVLRKKVGQRIITGHNHFSGIRKQCYSVGMTGSLDQDYNETEFSNWNKGFAVVSHYGGKTFIQLIDVQDNSAWFGKVIKAKRIEVPEMQFNISFTTKQQKRRQS